MTEPNEVPLPAEIPTPTFIDVSTATHELLLRIDAVQAHSQPSAYLISARAMVVNSLSQIQAHFAVLEARAAAQQPTEA